MKDPNLLNQINQMRPRPSNFVVWASTNSTVHLYDKAKAKGMIKRDTKWTLVFEDYDYNQFDNAELSQNTNFLTPTERSCCGYLDKADGKGEIIL